MVLRGPHGTRFQLSILKYPDSPIKYDNWATVEVRVHDTHGFWRASDACLMGDEVTRLADWLEHAVEKPDNPVTISFLEPELAFALHTTDHSQHTLRDIFAYNLRPGWASPDPWDNLWLDFPVTEQGLRRAAHDLRQQLASLVQHCANDCRN